MANEDGSGRKRTRSWREIDKNRGSLRKPNRDEDQRQEKLQQTQAYQDYKRNLEKMLGGAGDVPDTLKGALDPSGEKGKREAALKQLKKLEAEDRKAWSAAVVTFVQEHELPDDPYFLDSLLDHSNFRVADKALTKLEQLVADGKLTAAKKPRSLEQRLKSVELTSLDDEHKVRAKALREKLG
jgi:hypothetical protein